MRQQPHKNISSRTVKNKKKNDDSASQTISNAEENQPVNPDVTESSSTTDHSQNPPAVVVERSVNFAEWDAWLRTDFLGRIKTCDETLSVEMLTNEICEMQSEKKNLTKESTDQDLSDYCQQLLDFLNEKWKSWGGISDELNDYSNMLNELNDSLSTVQELDDKTNAEVEEANNQVKVFNRKEEQKEQRLENINLKIDFATKTRDDLCSKIMEMDKAEADIGATIETTRLSNQQSKDQIAELTNALKNEEEFHSMLSNDASHWLVDKEATIAMLDHIKSELKKEVKKLTPLMKEELNAKKKVCEAIEILIKEGDKLTEQMDREQHSTELRIKTAETEFNQKNSSLSEEIKEVSDATMLIQCEMDRIQRQYDDFKRTLSGIETTQETNRVLGLKLRQKKDEKWKQEHKISIMAEYINETKQRQNKKRTRKTLTSKRAFASKRQRLSTSTLVDRVDQKNTNTRNSESSYNLKDLDQGISTPKSNF